MSEEEKKAIEKAKPVWWERAKRYFQISQLLHNMFFAAGIIWGVGQIVDSRVAEILATPKRTTALEKRDSVQFGKTDSALIRHNGAFNKIFERVDTADRSSANIRYTRK